MARSKKKKIKVKWKRIGALGSILAIIAIILIICYNIFILIHDNLATSKMIDKINDKIEIGNIVDNEDVETIPPEDKISKFDPYWEYIKQGLLDVSMADLKAMNVDTVGFVEIEGTDFSYPIVDNSDDFYSDHSFDKKKNRNGWLYFDSKSNIEEFETNTIIHLNKKMFSPLVTNLDDVFKKTWQEDNSNFIIKLSTNYSTSIWQIISIYQTKENTHIEPIEDIDKFINNSIAKSSYKFKAEAKSTDKFLTITTDSNSSNDVVLAKLVKIKKEQ